MLVLHIYYLQGKGSMKQKSEDDECNTKDGTYQIFILIIATVVILEIQQIKKILEDKTDLP